MSKINQWRLTYSLWLIAVYTSVIGNIFLIFLNIQLPLMEFMVISISTIFSCVMLGYSYHKYELLNDKLRSETK